MTDKPRLLARAGADYTSAPHRALTHEPEAVDEATANEYARKARMDDVDRLMVPGNRLVADLEQWRQQIDSAHHLTYDRRRAFADARRALARLTDSFQ
jgi:hypothetical protein